MNKLVLSDGDFEIIASLKDKQGNEIIVYTDNKLDEDNFAKAYVGRVSDDEIIPVSDENILAMVDKVLKKLEKDNDEK